MAKIIYNLLKQAKQFVQKQKKAQVQQIKNKQPDTNNLNKNLEIPSVNENSIDNMLNESSRIYKKYLDLINANRGKGTIQIVVDSEDLNKVYSFAIHA